MSVSLCERCLVMTSSLDGLKALASTEGYAHHNYKGLHQSTLGGCQLCILVRSTGFTKFSAHTKSTKRVHVFATPRQSQDTSEHSIFSIQSLIFDAGGKQKLRLEAFSSKDDPATKFLQTNFTAVRVTGGDIVQNIKTLIKDCKLFHKNCPRYLLPPLPTRVIDIGPEVSDKSKLHIATPGQQADYCCLSYIWGGPQEILTTTLNMEAHQIVIPSFPRTIQDAISVVRSLGFRYLWVDALCIIQNDENDKAKEIDQMGQYYKNATITISACNSSNVNDGFLEDRPIRHACCLPMYLPTGNGNIWLRKDLDVMDRPGWDRDKIDTRGWTFQETVLSPRLLRYGTTELIWKCHTEHFKPVWPTYAFFLEEGNELIPSTIFGLPRNQKENEPRLRNSNWIGLVRLYSGRELTIWRDRLPALAGIVKELQNIWKDKYIAGTWRDLLIKQLAWHKPFKDKGCRTPPIIEGLPSWSWASFPGPVEFKHILTEDAKLIDSFIELSNKRAPFGNVDGGTIYLKAVLVEADSLPGFCDLDYPQTEDFVEKIYCLRLGRGRNTAQQEVTGLVLRKLEDGYSFSRIGLINVPNTIADVLFPNDIESRVICIQ